MGATGATLAADSTGNVVEDGTCITLGGVEVIGCPFAELPCPSTSNCCSNGSVGGDDDEKNNGDCSTKTTSGSDGRAVMAGHARAALGNQSACHKSSGSSIFDGFTVTLSLFTAGADEVTY